MSTKSLSFCLLMPMNADTGYLEWYLLGEENSGKQQGRLEDLQAQLWPNTEVILLLPGTEVAVKTLVMPTLSERKLLAAIPFALEEKLAIDCESCHFAILARAKEELTIAVVDKQKLQSWLQPFAAANVKVSRCLPDYLLLPLHEESFSLLRLPQHCSLRLGKNIGMGVELNNAATLLQLLQQEKRLTEKGRFYQFSADEYATFSTLEKVTKQQCNSREEFPELCCQQLQALPREHNLLQGEFKVQISSSTAKRYWQFSVVLWLCTLLLLCFSGWRNYQSLLKQSEQLDSDILTLYQQVFPESHAAYSPKIVIEREIKKRAATVGQQEFLNLLHPIAEQVRQQAIEVENMNYQQGRLITNMLFPDFSSLQNFTNDLQSKNLLVKRDNAFSKENRVQARLIIEMGQP